jgi:hypothetical protein
MTALSDLSTHSLQNYVFQLRTLSVFNQLHPSKFKCSWTLGEVDILKDHSACMYMLKHLDSLTL